MVPRPVALLQAISASISKRQLVRLPIAGQDEFPAESRDVLCAGLLVLLPLPPGCA
jgi:hypothetical protein